MQITRILVALTALALIAGCAGYSQTPTSEHGDHGRYVEEGDRPAGFYDAPREAGGGGPSSNIGGLNGGSNGTQGNGLGTRRTFGSTGGLSTQTTPRVIDLTR